MSDTRLYLRVKRRNQTFCLLCDKQDSIENIKQKVAACLEQHKDEMAQQSMRLLLPDQTILDDSKTIQEYEDDIKENAVLHLVFAVGDDDNEYETVDIASTDFQETKTAAAAGTN